MVPVSNDSGRMAGARIMGADQLGAAGTPKAENRI